MSETLSDFEPQDSSSIGVEDHSSLSVLVVCGGSYVSGMEIMALSVMRGLQQRGHKVRCITSAWNDGDFLSRLEQSSIPYRAVRIGYISKTLEWKYIRWTLNALLHLPKAWYDYWQEKRAFQPDLVLFYGFTAASLLKPFLVSGETVFHAQEVPTGSLHMQRVIGEEATFVAISEHVGKRLKAQGIDEENIFVVYNGVESPADLPVRTSTETQRVKIGIAGQVGEWKGHDDLIEALQILDMEDDSVQCHIVGRGEDDYTRALKQKIEQYDLTAQVVWRGFQVEMRPIYQELDLLVVPSRHEEPFGLVAAEAGLYGLPVIATRRGGLPEIVADGETGYLVDVKAPRQIAERLDRLINEPELRVRMGTAGRARVLSKFTREKMVDGIENVLYSVERKRADCAGQSSFD